ncbi:N-acetylmuramoyl-L-alanine amidase [Clostridium sp. BJN0001]|uniref:N-acetylmuramoyl-L-alanine amidase n=1 Tax=Clostridium sp. BJN0001 TaxID=2930219 RepID=UPI001FD1DC53|nr:N-acetylmuramoyl-L-alanine amidase [Clostridium sp. BJN0001]
MRTKRILKVLCIFFILLFIYPFNGKYVLAENTESKKIILVDPGHGGIDSGAKSKSGTLEKDINLQISLKLGEKLKEEGYEVVFTREDDSEISRKKAKDLKARCDMKQDKKCDAFISIHQNTFPQESCFGAQVWYADNDSSRNFAELAQNSLKENINDGNKRVAKPAKDQYKILRDSYSGPSILVECGFLSNNKEEKMLKTDEHQNDIVDAIVKAVNEYFSEK